MSSSHPLISVIVIFFNMRREAPRTLHSLTRGYQRDCEDIQYEVIAIDNGSPEPLSQQMVEAFGPEFSYHYFDTASCSPVDAVNHGATLARGRLLTISIDGARILSPGILASISRLSGAYEAPFIYTLGLHLGPDIQNDSVLKGYNQQVEDELLDKSGWERDGYQLFTIASLAGSSIEGYLGPLAESNCFCIPENEFTELGGFNPRFQTPGGGLVNLDFFQRACQAPGMTPVVLLGEGTFHQVHGGVATNVPMQDHPMETYQEEYRLIYGHSWEIDKSLQPVFFGRLHPAARGFLEQAPMSAPTRCVLILGMHRSGTSALSNYLVELGFSLPSASLPPHPQDNPRGYWESSEVVELNNRLLQAFSMDWKDIGALPQDWQQNAIATGIAAKIGQLLTRALETSSQIVIKDPRLSRLLPVWLPVLQACFDHVAILFIVRRPDAVFRSLSRRSEVEAIAAAAITDESHARALWLRYNLEAEANTSGLAKFTLGYEHWLNNNETLSAAIRDFLTEHLPEANMANVSASLNRPRHGDTDSPGDECPTGVALNGIYNALTQGDNPQYLNDFISRLSVAVPEENQREAERPAVAITAPAFLKHMTGPASQPGQAPRRSLLSSLFTRRRTGALVFISDSPASKSHIYRVKNRVDALCSLGIPAVWFTPAGALQSPAVLASARAIIVHRCEWNPVLAELYAGCKKWRTRIGYDIDDYLFDTDIIEQGYSLYIESLPVDEQAVWRKRIEGFQTGIKYADFAIATTAPLARQLQRLNDRTILIPNGFSSENLAMASHWRKVRPFPADGRKRLGYASGTPTHDADFATVENPVTDFLNKHPDWLLTIIGCLDVAQIREQINPAQLELRPAVAHINLACELARLDINLVPLEQDNPFCDAKSPLKWYEAALAGTPSIVIGNALYTDLLDEGVDGLIARCEADWSRHLATLANDAALRGSLADRARDKCLAEFNEERAVRKLLSFIESSHYCMGRLRMANCNETPLVE